MPDTVEVLMRMPKPPEGWEYIGEVRVPLDREGFLDHYGNLSIQDGDYQETYPILRKIITDTERLNFLEGLQRDKGKDSGGLTVGGCICVYGGGAGRIKGLTRDIIDAAYRRSLADKGGQNTDKSE